MLFTHVYCTDIACIVPYCRLSIMQGGTHSLLFDKAVVHSIFGEIATELSLTKQKTAATSAAVTMPDPVLANINTNTKRQSIDTTNPMLNRRCSIHNRESTVHYVNYSTSDTCKATAAGVVPNTRKSSIGNTLTCVKLTQCHTADKQCDTSHPYSDDRRSSVSSENSSSNRLNLSAGMLSPRYVSAHEQISLHNALQTYCYWHDRIGRIVYTCTLLVALLYSK
jgi:hypothetical protein